MSRPKNTEPRLSDKEAEIMKILWDDSPRFVREILDFLPNPKPHFNTVSTTVRILEDKGFVAHEVVGGAHRYYPIVKASDFAGKGLSQLVRNFFNNSYSKVVSALVEEEKITVDELQDIIDMINRKNKS